MVATIQHCAGFRTVGRLASVRGALSADLPAAVGELCYIQTDGQQMSLAEVVGFSKGLSQLMLLEPAESLSAGARVVGLNRKMTIPVGKQLMGRVLDAMGRPIDNNHAGSKSGNGMPLIYEELVPLQRSSPNPMTRKPISQPLKTGQRAIDGMLTIGVGQRVGLFAGSGVGKSTLLGEIAKSDVNVVVLVGERGREVRPFIEDCLGKEGLSRSIVIVSTADQPPLVRIRSAETAVTIADWFRNRGNHVLFMVDSLTRLAWSQR